MTKSEKIKKVTDYWFFGEKDGGSLDLIKIGLDFAEGVTNESLNIEIKMIGGMSHQSRTFAMTCALNRLLVEVEP